MGKTVYTAKFKTDRVLEVLREETELGAIAKQHNLNPNMLRTWRKEFLANCSQIFDESRRDREHAAKERALAAEHEELLKTVGQLTIERDWLKKNQWKCLDLNTKKGLVESHSELSVARQCELLSLNISTFYYKPAEETLLDKEKNEKIRAAIDRWHTLKPAFGCRKLVVMLAGEGIKTNRKQVQKFMAEMGIYAVYPKPNLSKRNQKHKIYPYLLRKINIFLPNQVWAVDITYIKLRHGHMYLTAIIDWYSRFIVGWELSDTLDTAPVLQAIQRAIEAHGTPGIINSDQGSQFTSEDYTAFLSSQKIRQSMDGKARWVDNVIIERWFRSLKTEDIYINEYNSPKELRHGIADYIKDYNSLRPHQTFDYATPHVVYTSKFKGIEAA